MKSYTDLKQSKRLAEILPLESADMYWWSSGKDYYIEAIDDGDFIENRDIRAWSLTALLKMLKDYQLFSNGLIVYIDNESYKIDSDNPIDACYKMIIKLHEQNIL